MAQKMKVVLVTKKMNPEEDYVTWDMARKSQQTY